MFFTSLKNVIFMLTLVLMTGCSSLNIGWSDWAKNIAKEDCDVYNRGTAQFDECSERVDSLYKEHYSIKVQGE